MKNSKIRVRFSGSCLKQGDIIFTPINAVNVYIVYELDAWSRDLNGKFTLKGCLFRAVKLTKNADLDKYSYCGYGIGFDSRSFSSLQNDWGENVVILGVDNS